MSDEGNIFLTKVSGAPFQVLGRRNSAGELVDCEITIPPTDLKREAAYDDMRSRGVEILTGPEAERLVARLRQRWRGNA